MKLQITACTDMVGSVTRTVDIDAEDLDGYGPDDRMALLEEWARDELHALVGDWDLTDWGWKVVE